MAGGMILFPGTRGPGTYCLSFPEFQKKLGDRYRQRETGLFKWGAGIVQWLKHLPHKQRGLILIPGPK